MSCKSMYDALRARNAAQASPGDKWPPMPWCVVGPLRGDVEAYYSLPRLDPDLVGKVFGFDDADSDGTPIICHQSYDGKWQFPRSGTAAEGARSNGGLVGRPRNSITHGALRLESKPSQQAKEKPPPAESRETFPHHGHHSTGPGCPSDKGCPWPKASPPAGWHPHLALAA